MTEMILSRAWLRTDTTVRAIAPLLLPAGPARLGAAHRLVWSLMSDGPDRTRDYLWREERPGAFLILAPRVAAGGGGLFDIESKPWSPRFRVGDQLGFLLRANPTVERSTEDPSRKRTLGRARSMRDDVVMHALYPVPASDRAARRPELMVEAGRDWLIGQGERVGFVLDLNQLRVDGYETVQIPRNGHRGDNRPAVVYSRLEFEGMLTVLNPVGFLAAVTGGFGRARAFGNGLMLLRRA